MDDVGVCDLGVRGDQSVKADSVSFSDKKHRVSGLDGVAALKTPGAGVGSTARRGGRRWTGHTEYVAGINQTGICNLGIGGDKSVKADAIPFGDGVHAIPGLDCVAAGETRGT